jgi:hypothetical protein
MATHSLLTWFALLFGEACLAGLTLGAFWYQEWQYALPTPRPAELQQPGIGDPIHIAGLRTDADKPTWLHFFNPSCPCSRFNIHHVRELIEDYGEDVQVIAVLEADDEAEALEAFAQLNLKCQAIVDRDGQIARQTGVYSTPQGVVLGDDGVLHYRGNYNLSRYCTAVETEFVRQAIKNCLASQLPLSFPAAATVAVGCELPINVTPVKVSEARGS